MSTKRVKRRAFLKAATGALGATVLAACTPSASPTQAPEPTQVVAQPTRAPEATKAEAATSATGATVVPQTSGATWQVPKLEGKTYVMWGLNYAPHVEKYHAIVDAFDQKTGARGEVQPQDWPLETKILAALAGGTAPDVACVMGKMLAPLVREQALIAFDDTVFDPVGIKPDQWFTPGAILPYRHEGKYYGVPTEDNAVASFLISREDWIQEAGAQNLWPPLRDGDPWITDYGELWDLATRLQKKDTSGNVTVWGYSGSGWDLQQFAGVCRMLDYQWWNPDEKKFDLDNDAAAQAIQILVADPVEKGIETNLSQTGQDLYAQGKVAIARGNMGIFPEALKNGIPITGCIAPPLVKGNKPLFVGEGGWGFIVPKGAKNAEIGIEISKFLSTVEGNSIYMTIYGGILPPIYAERDLPFWKEVKEKGTQIVRSWFPAQELTVYYPEGLGYYGPYEEAYTQVITLVRSAEMKPKEAAKQLQQLFTEVFEKWTKGE